MLSTGAVKAPVAKDAAATSAYFKLKNDDLRIASRVASPNRPLDSEESMDDELRHAEGYRFLPPYSLCLIKVEAGLRNSYCPTDVEEGCRCSVDSEIMDVEGCRWSSGR